MRSYLSLVTFSHTIFALPFALIGYTLGIQSGLGEFAWLDLLFVIACMVTARNAAMAFNRLVDAPIDAANERTVVRDIPAGRIGKTQALTFVAINVLLFVVFAGLLNRLCLYLSPVAIAVILGYSYTKRFTWFCHVVLGIGLALAPIGAYVAATASFAAVPVAYGFAVLCWVAGFDIVYALQDQEFDREHDLNSIPARFGTQNSLWLSRTLHLICVGILAWVSAMLVNLYQAEFLLVALSLGIFGCALIYQHRIVWQGDLSRIDRAFFTTNGLASVVYAGLILPALLVG